MNETFILLKVTHKKPIPEIATDIVAQRAYMWFYSQGIEVGVTATLVETPEKFKTEDSDARAGGL